MKKVEIPDRVADAILREADRFRSRRIAEERRRRPPDPPPRYDALYYEALRDAE